jgi:secreted trypsin-like serine protease
MLVALGTACEQEMADVSFDQQRIVGGEAVDIKDYPWQVALRQGNFQFCGGSILNESWILTAAHCMQFSGSNVEILAGVSKLSAASSGQKRKVSKVHIYPGFVDVDKGKDAALLKLASPLDLTGDLAKAIPIVTAADAEAGMTDAGIMSSVSGWGTLSAGGSSPDKLQAVEVPIITNEEADEAYTDVAITEDQLAAGIMGVGGKDACQGDSGGPLVIKNGQNYKLAGIVSWGYGCADAKYPGMYSRVSSFEQWIESTLNNVPPPPPPAIAVDNGAPMENLTGAKGSWTFYKIDVPQNATILNIATKGGTGDVDLYVLYNQAPDAGTYDCRPYTSGNNESCTIDSIQAGTYYMGLYGYSDYSSLTLEATYIIPAE